MNRMCPVSEINGLRRSNGPPLHGRQFAPLDCPLISDNGQLIEQYPLLFVEFV